MESDQDQEHSVDQLHDLLSRVGNEKHQDRKQIDHYTRNNHFGESNDMDNDSDNISGMSLKQYPEQIHEEVHIDHGKEYLQVTFCFLTDMHA